MKDRTLTDDEWIAEFEPEDKMYETYGEELAYINSMPAGYVWTLLDTDEQTVIVNGRSFVNRLGYYLSKKPHNPDDILVVV